MGLRLRLALVFALGSLSVLLIATGILYRGFTGEIRNRDQLLLASEVQDVVNVLVNHPGDLRALEEEVVGEYAASQEAPIRVRVIHGGQLLLESPGMERLLPAARFQEGARLWAGRSHFLVMERRQGDIRIQGALDVTGDDRLISSYRRRLLTTLALGAAFCALFGVWAAHQGLRPLRSLAASTRRVTVNRLQERLDPGALPQELRELVLALNEMLDRLDLAFSRLSRFSADLAHELRTPITNLMGEAEVILARERPAEEYRQVLESSLEEFGRLSRLISRMLFLARAEDPGALANPVAVPAERLLGEVLAFFEGAAAEQGVALLGEAEGTLSGDPDLLRQLLANLVVNALGATEAGGEVRVRIGAGAGRATLEVADTGRGIPADEIPHLLERFYRTRDALGRRSPGTGLGLAIVQSIARIHGGEVAIESRMGTGTTVHVGFPVR